MLKAEIENLSFAAMSSMDFAALLGNMLDNAIEASLREEEKEEMAYRDTGISTNEVLKGIGLK